jgi:hypothetical protein
MWSEAHESTPNLLPKGLLTASRATALQIKFRWKEMFPRDAKEMYAAANQKIPVKEAMKRMKSDGLDEHSG